MDPEGFTELIAQVTGRIAATPVDADLEAQLNRWYPPGSALMREVRAACDEAIAAGWMCSREHLRGRQQAIRPHEHLNLRGREQAFRPEFT